MCIGVVVLVVVDTSIAVVIAVSIACARAFGVVCLEVPLVWYCCGGCWCPCNVY